jgi:S1-C subfamily serine protease
MAEGTVELPQGLRDKPLDLAVVIRADAQYGMSGGPVIDAAGKVVAVLRGKIADRSPIEEKAGLPMTERVVAIPIEHAHAMAQALLAKTPAAYPFHPPTIGIRVEPVDAVDSTWKLDDTCRGEPPAHRTEPLPEGLLVRHIEDCGPSARAGLQIGDVIVKCNGVRVRSVADFQRATGFLSGDSPPSARLLVHRWVSDTEREEKTMTVQLRQPVE